MHHDSATEVQVGYGIADLTRDLAALIGFSAALAVTAGLIKTRIGVPGHSAIFWLPVLVLAGCYRRPGMALGAVVCGGLVAGTWGGLRGMEFSGLLASAAAIEAFGVGTSARSRGLRMLLAGLLGHLGKLGVKALAFGVAGLPLNRAGLTLFPTLTLYAAFGLAGGIMAWGILSAWLRLRGVREDE